MSRPEASDRSDTPAFLQGDGEMGARIRAHDWASTPLGPPETWPTALRAALGICLQSSFPTAIYWGPELRLLYNDAWAPIPAERHPWALGRPAREVWSDIWDLLQPQIRQVLEDGQGFATFNEYLPMVRDGEPRETYWNYSFTPIRDEDGRVAGIFNQGHETTDQVLGERRHRFLLALTDRLRGLAEPRAIIDTAQAALGEHLKAGRVGYGEVDATARWFTTERNWTDGSTPPRHGTHDLEGFGPEVVAALRAGEPLVVDDVATDPRTSTPDRLAAFAAIETRAVVTASLVKEGRMRAALYVHSSSPRRWSRGDVELVADVAERTWSAVERATAEARLRESEGRLGAALAVAQSGAFEWNLRSDEVSLDERAREIFGFRPDEPVTGEAVFARIAPEDVARVRDAALASQAKLERLEVEYRVNRLDGSVREVLSLSDAIAGEDGTAERMIGVFKDVTDRRRTEIALAASEERLRGAFAIRTVGIMVWSDGFGLTDMNEAFLAMTGFNREEALGRTWQDLTPPEFHDASLKAVEEVGSRGESTPYEKQYYRKDGSRWWGLFAARKVGDETVEFVLDVSERREAEAQLRILNETLEAQVAERTADRDRMWRLSTDVMLVAQMDATINAVNPAWSRLLGWAEAELVGRSFVDLIHPDDRAATIAEMRKLGEGITTFRFENRYRAADGSYRWLSWIAVPDAGLVHAVGRDITAEKTAAAELAQAQEALRQSQKMDAMGQLTGGVAHDFNNLLTPIVGSLDLLQRRAVGGEREHRLIDSALQSAERAKTLVQRLLAFARRQPLQPTAVDIAAIVTGMADLIASTSGPRVRLALDIAPGLPPALADANQVEMALLNLAVNARDAMPEGGALTIGAHAESVEGTAHPAGLAAGRYVRLSVADTGTGMDEATLKRAIEPFFSTKGIGKGTGLGLSMVHGLAAQLGGGLTIRSRPGLGTNVELWLPASAGAAVVAERAETSDRLNGAGTALLVDDEELVRMSTADMLADLGYDVVEASSAEEALRRIDDGLAFDLVVTDHLMPGMTGIELAREVQERRPGAAVLIVSGYAEMDGVAPDLLRLTKPFRRADLAASLAGLTTALSPEGSD